MSAWRILIVDDDRVSVTLLTAALRELATVDTAASGDEALQRLEAEPLPDLILLDAMMPGLGGLEVCAHLKASPSFAAIPVIFVTGQTDQKVEVKALAAGAVDFISKPLNIPVVQARINIQLTLLSQNRSLRAANRALEERIAVQSSKMEGLLNSIPDPIWFKDAGGVYLTVNPATLLAFERSEATLTGDRSRELFSTEIAAQLDAHDREVLATGVPGTYELETRSPKTGDRVLWEIIKTPITPYADRLDGVLSIARDVTLRKDTEQQLRMLSLAVEQSPNAIIITDGESRIEYVNDAFTRITGYAAATAIGQRAGFFKSGKTPPATYAEMWSALKSGKPWQGRFSNLTQNGKEIIEFAHVTAILDINGRIIHYLSIQEDITERVRLAKELSHTRAAIEVAEAANEAKSRFLANMSHEIRTPMNAIIGLTHLLLREKPSPQQKDRLEKVSVAAEHLLGIINDILDISKIEAGRMELSPIDFRLADLMTNVSALVTERVRAKGINFSASVTGLPPVLHGDAMRLTQILLNYIGNAIKFTAAGSIKLTGTLLEESDDDALLCFTVEDTGVGISPEHLPRMFQAFEQGDKSTTRKYGGTGLGLRINRHLAHLMGGETGVESQLGVGSKFWVTTRLGKANSKHLQALEPIPDSSEATAKLAGAHVLLAEDNLINQEVALVMLEHAGIVADLANDGAEAVALANARQYELILMDMQMPEMDGLAATRAIRRLSGYATTPIIAMTANAFSEDRQACLSAGMNDHVAKPVNPDTLYTTLLK